MRAKAPLGSPSATVGSTGLTTPEFQLISCQHTQPELNIKLSDGLACSNGEMNSSTLKGSSATGLMDTYSRDRDSSAGLVIQPPSGGRTFSWHPASISPDTTSGHFTIIQHPARGGSSWAEVPQRPHLNFFSVLNHKDFYSSFLSGCGPKKAMSPVTDLQNWMPHKNRFFWDLQLILYFVKCINSASQTHFRPSFNSANKVNKKCKLNGEQRLKPLSVEGGQQDESCS